MRTIITTLAIALLAIGAWAIGNDNNAERNTFESDTPPHKTTPEQQARMERRAARLAEYEQHIDSLVTSHNFKFIPQTMQQLPAGMMRNLNSAMYEVTIGSQAVDVCIPYLKGYVPPYYPVIFNYVLPSVMGYNAEKSSNGWHVSFKTTMFSATEYTFLFDISAHYGDVVLTISSPYYNSVQYTGNIVGI
jgi:hypothetical protein